MAQTNLKGLLLLVACMALHMIPCNTQSCQLGTNLVLEQPLLVGGWNAQRFGKTKISKPRIPEYMAKMMVRYDIFAIQEVTDSSQTSIYEFLDVLNFEAYTQSPSYNPDDALATEIPNAYDVAVSQRVGDLLSSYREQYIVYYRRDRVSFVEGYNYNDTEAFKYDPYVAVFQTPSIDIDKLAVIVVHTSPDRAVTEIDRLVDVYETVSPMTGAENVVILGDFNAGCSYVTGNDWENIRLFKDSRFTWLISEHIDTTVKSTSCPYDRIVVAGPQLLNLSYPGSAQAFHFDDFLELNDTEVAKDISDHFPVEFEIKGKLKSTLIPTLSVSVELPSSKPGIRDMYINCKAAATNTLDPDYTFENACGGTPTSVVGTDNNMAITFSTNSTEETVMLLHDLEFYQKCVVNHEVRSILEYKLVNGVLHDSSLYLREENPKQKVIVSCRYNLCKTSVETTLDIL